MSKVSQVTTAIFLGDACPEYDIMDALVPLLQKEGIYCEYLDEPYTYLVFRGKPSRRDIAKAKKEVEGEDED